MAGFLPNETRARTLEAIVGKTAVAIASRYVGLALALPADPATSTLATITEVTTAGYARKITPTWNAATTVAPIQIVEPTAFAFNSLTADMVSPAYYAFLTDAASGTAGLIWYIWELTEPLQGRTGEPLNIPANMMTIE